MKVDLSKDPLFQKKESPAKEFKQKQREKYKMRSSNTNTSSTTKPQSKIEIIDPLPQELHKYKDDIEYKRTFESSRASHKLKKYIIEQERNLKCIRLERITGSLDINSSRVRKSDLKIDMSSRSLAKDNQQKNKQIHIPKIEEMFKNQQKQFVLYESKMMRNQLAKAINLIDNGVTKLKSYTFSGALPSGLETRKNTASDKFQQANLLFSSTVNEEDYEIDKIIQRKLNMSQKLRDKMYKQKKQMSSNQAKQTTQNKSLNFFLTIPQKPKRKVMLKGVKSITYCEGERRLKITPASSLLFSLNRMSNGRERKQEELEGLIQNSYQNRDSILFQKSNFYEQQNPFNNLNPSSQFKLRQLMDKKLQHRLELSKDQVNKFVGYLSEMKQYHVILNDAILQILKEVRDALLSGKVMKSSDLTQIVSRQSPEQLKKYPNEIILMNLGQMMI